MAGVFVDEGLLGSFIHMLGSSDTRGVVPTQIDLLSSAPPPDDPTRTYATISGFLAGLFQTISPTAWTFSAVQNTWVGQATFNFTFSSAFAGNTYYGYALYGTDGGGNKRLVYYELFSTPFTVPPAGGVATILPNLTNRDCSIPFYTFDPLKYGLISWWQLGEAATHTRADSYGSATLSESGGPISNGPGPSPVTGPDAVFTGSAFLDGTDLLEPTGSDEWWVGAWINPSSAVSGVIVLDSPTGYSVGFLPSRQVLVESKQSSGQQVLSAALTLGQWAFVLAWKDKAAGTLNVQIDLGSIVSTATTGQAPGSAVWVGPAFVGQVGPVAVGANPPGGIASLISSLGSLLFNGGYGQRYPF